MEWSSTMSCASGCGLLTTDDRLSELLGEPPADEENDADSERPADCSEWEDRVGV